ncbi:MAG: hypothetical protein P8165_05435 [Deltaproteobacteria bacterium]|jgi:hypothetical protein
MAQWTKTRVECYAGYRGEETPRRFWYAGMPISIEETEKQWIEPDCRYFRVRGDDSRIYILRQDTRTYQWEVRAHGDKS